MKLLATCLLLTIPFLFLGLSAPRQTDREAEPAAGAKQKAESEKALDRVIKADAEWRKILTPEQYRITRKKGTERPFSGKFNKFKEKGTFVCVCCGNPLFDSSTKFDSGTGWPSFYQPIEKGRVGEVTDTSHGMIRTEVICARCDAHLGHVFSDGPRPTGLRYCINSVALDFVKHPDKEKISGDSKE